MQATALTTCRRTDGDSYWQISLFSYPYAPDGYPIGYEAVARLDGKDFEKTIIPGESGLMGGFREEWDALWSAHNWVSGCSAPIMGTRGHFVLIATTAVSIPRC